MVPRRTSEARAYLPRSKQCECVQGLAEKRDILLIVVESQATNISNISPGQSLSSVFEYSSVNESHWLKSHSNACRSQFAKNHLRVFLEYSNSPKTTSGTCLVTSQWAWWPDAAGQRHTRAAWQITHNHTYINWPFTTIHRCWGELGANCPSPARTPISVLCDLNGLWNLRKNPVRDERVRPYDERRWFEKRTYFIAMIFAMHPFHVFNIYYFLSFLIRFPQILTNLFRHAFLWVTKAVFLEDKGIITTWNKKAEEAGKMAQKCRTEAFPSHPWICHSQEALLMCVHACWSQHCISWSCPSY